VVFAAQPIVQLPYGSIGGVNVNDKIERFLGIPYTDGPTTRFVEGVLPSTPIGFLNATQHGPICPQLNPRGGGNNVQDDTLCLNLDIARPPKTDVNSQLPVLVWIYGGAFTSGQIVSYDPSVLVPYGIQIGQPFIFVAMNYRLHAYGWLSSREHKARNALNLGLKDQRLAMTWVKRYINFFGGDPNKVTLFGESAGAISIGYHLIAYGGQKDTGLFRGAILESGGATSVVIPDVASKQEIFDYLVNTTGCQGATSQFKCLQFTPTAKFQAAVQEADQYWLSKGKSSMTYGPVLDGDFIPSQPSALIKKGYFVKVPIINGENLDEGTMFINKSSDALNTDQQYETSLRTSAPNLSDAEIAQWEQLYPNVPALGSPYGTGNRTFFNLQFKRAASTFGDNVFVSARRYLAERSTERQVPVWTYLYNVTTGDVTSPTYTGVTHAAEIGSVFRFADTQVSKSMAAYWIAFANHLNPNTGVTGVTWNKFTIQGREQIRFSNDEIAMAKDDYRMQQIEFVNARLSKLQR